jgi:hypothetical protein
MEGSSPAKYNDNILYNDNYIKNYEDLACCNNLILSTIVHDNGNNFMNYINDFCFRKEDINDNEEIIKYPSQQNITTPLCSNNNINNNNNININNDVQDIKSILSENQSNNSAAEPADPIMSIKKFNSLVNHNKNKKRNLNHKNRRNLFSVLSDLFKDFFNENEKVKNEKDKNDNLLNLKHRPILKRIIEKDILSPLQLNNKNEKNRNDNLSESLNRANTYQNQNNNHNISLNNNIRSPNTIIYERRELFADDILSYDISEENDDENIQELVSYIPIFKVKEKEKSIDNSNKCSICLCEFEIGEEKSTLPCLHYFHFNCIEKWIKRKKYCPICKYQLSFESLRKNIDYENLDK